MLQLILLEKWSITFHVIKPMYTLWWNLRVSCCFTSLPTLCIIKLKRIFANLLGRQWYFIVVSLCIFLVIYVFNTWNFSSVYWSNAFPCLLNAYLSLLYVSLRHLLKEFWFKNLNTDNIEPLRGLGDVKMNITHHSQCT